MDDWAERILFGSVTHEQTGPWVDLELLQSYNGPIYDGAGRLVMTQDELMELFIGDE